MNLPNILTLARVPMMFVIVGLMYEHWLGAASLAFWLFIGGAISDWLDGYLARKRGIVSVFGKLMDALTDKIMVIGIMVALADQNVIPMFYVLITLCREGKRFERGMYSLGGPMMHVSRGIGMEGGHIPRVRFFSRPDVSVIELVPR